MELEKYGPSRTLQKEVYPHMMRSGERDIVTLDLLHPLCSWAVGSVVKGNNVSIHRGAAKDIKYKYKLGHTTCDSKGIYPEMFMIDLHAMLCFTISNGNLKTLFLPRMQPTNTKKHVSSWFYWCLFWKVSIVTITFVQCRSRQSHVLIKGPDYPHQSPEVEAPVSGGTSGTLPAGAEATLHQGGGECLLDPNIQH